MGKDLRTLHAMIDKFKKGEQSDIELYMLVYKAYMLGLKDYDQQTKQEKK